jgi:hypothetical protein
MKASYDGFKLYTTLHTESSVLEAVTAPPSHMLGAAFLHKQSSSMEPVADACLAALVFMVKGEGFKGGLTEGHPSGAFVRSCLGAQAQTVRGRPALNLPMKERRTSECL